MPLKRGTFVPFKKKLPLTKLEILYDFKFFTTHPGRRASQTPGTPSVSAHRSTLKSFLFFSLSFQFVPNSLFKKEKLAKSSLLNASKNHENNFLNRCGIKYYAIFSGHIGAGYREIQEIGSHRRGLLTLAGRPGLERIYVLGLEITYLLMYL
jgi:hypothetical protein